jgi:hypothetical protein
VQDGCPSLQVGAGGAVVAGAVLVIVVVAGAVVVVVVVAGAVVFATQESTVVFPVVFVQPGTVPVGHVLVNVPICPITPPGWLLAGVSGHKGTPDVLQYGICLFEQENVAEPPSLAIALKLKEHAISDKLISFVNFMINSL